MSPRDAGSHLNGLLDSNRLQESLASFDLLISDLSEFLKHLFLDLEVAADLLIENGQLAFAWARRSSAVADVIRKVDDLAEKMMVG